jgi:hypothetical protein
VLYLIVLARNFISQADVALESNSSTAANVGSGLVAVRLLRTVV